MNNKIQTMPCYKPRHPMKTNTLNEMNRNKSRDLLKDMIDKDEHKDILKFIKDEELVNFIEYFNSKSEKKILERRKEFLKNQEFIDDVVTVFTTDFLSDETEETEENKKETVAEKITKRKNAEKEATKKEMIEMFISSFPSLNEKDARKYLSTAGWDCEEAGIRYNNDMVCLM